MSYDFARDLRANLPEDTALRYYFLYNLHPRVLLTYLAVAKEALRLASNGDFTTKLESPTERECPLRRLSMNRTRKHSWMRKLQRAEVSSHV